MMLLAQTILHDKLILHQH